MAIVPDEGTSFRSCATSDHCPAAATVTACPAHRPLILDATNYGAGCLWSQTRTRTVRAVASLRDSPGRFATTRPMAAILSLRMEGRDLPTS